MTLEEFRLTHSELIEQYQYIEYHLEGIYSCLCEDKSFSEGMIEVEKDTIRRLLVRIRARQSKIGKEILTENELDAIKGVCDHRNFWCHMCYVDLAFDYKTGNVKYSKNVEMMLQDLAETKEIREWLFKKKVPLLDGKRSRI